MRETFNIGNRIRVINEGDEHYGMRGNVEEIDADVGTGCVLGPVLLGVRFDDTKSLSPFWPSELRHISAVDQLSELV